jgi:hypothetical protein
VLSLTQSIPLVEPDPRLASIFTSLIDNGPEEGSVIFSSLFYKYIVYLYNPINCLYSLILSVFNLGLETTVVLLFGYCAIVITTAIVITNAVKKHFFIFN